MKSRLLRVARPVDERLDCRFPLGTLAELSYWPLGQKTPDVRVMVCLRKMPCTGCVGVADEPPPGRPL